MLCFTVPQAKYIAQELSNGWYSDSIASAYASRDDVFQKLIVEKDRRLELEKKSNLNLKNQIDLYGEINKNCKEEIEYWKDKNLRLKTGIFMLSLGLGGAIFYGITK